MPRERMTVLHGRHTVWSWLCSNSLHSQGNTHHQQSYPDVKLMSNIIPEHGDKLAPPLKCRWETVYFQRDSETRRSVRVFFPRTLQASSVSTAAPDVISPWLTVVSVFSAYSCFPNASTWPAFVYVLLPGIPGWSDVHLSSALRPPSLRSLRTCFPLLILEPPVRVPMPL